MRIVSYYARPDNYRLGGVNTSRQDWMYHLAQEGHSVTIISAQGGYSDELRSHRLLEYRPISHIGSSRRSMIPVGLGRELRGADLLYLHEGWTLSNQVAAGVARRMGIPYIVMPHGVYESEIVRLLRNIPGRMSMERRMLVAAAAVHLFLPGEVEQLHALAPTAPAMVVPTGFDDNGSEWAPGSPHYLAWVGRFDVHHKGIDVLLSALAVMPPAARPLLRMVGPDYDGGVALTRQLIRDLGLAECVSVEPPLSGFALRQFVGESAGFVHTPRWECLGRTVVDALLAGVPVLVAQSAEIAREASRSGAAITPPLECHAISQSLVQLLSPQAVEVARRGREWARDYFDWGKSMSDWHHAVRELLPGISLRRSLPQDPAQ